MSFTSSAAYPVDRHSDLFGQGYIDPCNDFFDEYLTFDSIDNEDSIFPDLSESTHLVKSISDSQSAGTSSTLVDDQARHSSVQLTRGEPLDFPQNAASPQLHSHPDKHFYFEESGRAAVSDGELLSLEGITLQSPRVAQTPSLPSSPHPGASGGRSLRRKPRFIQSITKTFRKATGDSNFQQKIPTRKPSSSPIRKPSSPLKMMRASQYSEQNLEDWSHRLAVDATKFDFGFTQPSAPLSPPPSARVSDASDNSMTMIAGPEQQHDAFTWDQPIPQYGTRGPANPHTPLATPTYDIHSFHSSHLPPTDILDFPPTSQHESTTPWVQGSMSSDFNDNGTSYVPQNDSAPLWWNHASTSPIAHPAPAVYHRNAMDNTKSLAMQLQNELAYNANELALSPSNLPSGLMIQMPLSPLPQSFVVSSPMEHHNGSGYFGTSHLNELQQMSSMTSPRLRYTQSQPLISSRCFTSPQHLTSPSSRKPRTRQESDSESPSPTNCSPRAASFHVAKRRSVSRKHSMHSLGSIPSLPPPRMPKSVSGGAADFVNFTPGDSHKILTGVAPSGSSKTKARREKEAMEKRRRLSQAAMRAVQAAGGSIEGLVEEGLFV